MLRYIVRVLRDIVRVLRNFFVRYVIALAPSAHRVRTEPDCFCSRRAEIVLQAFILTLSTFVCLTSYTMQSKRDYSSWGAGLFAALWLLIGVGILGVKIIFTFLEVLNSLKCCRNKAAIASLF